jgi:hypothetical protein
VATFSSEDPFLKRGVAPEKVLPIKVWQCLGEDDRDVVHDSETVRKTLLAAGAKRVVRHLPIPALGRNMPKDSKDVGRQAYAAMKKILEKKLSEIHPPAPPEPYPERFTFDNPGWDSPYTSQGVGKPVKIDREKLRLGGECHRVIDDLLCDPNTELFTWTIPPEAPEGWGVGGPESVTRYHHMQKFKTVGGEPPLPPGAPIPRPITPPGWMEPPESEKIYVQHPNEEHSHGW